MLSTMGFSFHKVSYVNDLIKTFLTVEYAYNLKMFLNQFNWEHLNMIWITDLDNYT